MRSLGPSAAALTLNSGRLPLPRLDLLRLRLLGGFHSVERLFPPQRLIVLVQDT